MSALPENWIATEIGGLCSLKNGRAFKPNEWQTSGLPIVRIQNLNNPASAFNHFQGEVDERNRLRSDDVPIGDGIGNTGVEPVSTIAS